MTNTAANYNSKNQPQADVCNFQLQYYMTDQLQNENLIRRNEATLPAKFIAICGVAFLAGVSATAYFCSSMSGEMEMPGGWKMSMTWMRMPGQTWFLSTLSFLLMWLAMMVAMMMPSALQMFLKTRRQWLSLCYMAFGYFTIWSITGLGIYMLGVEFNNATMRSEFLSRAVPLLSGASLIAAGMLQFTRWKMMHLSRCRSPFGCAGSCPQDETSFRLGCKQGVACCICCSSLMATQLVLGIMNPLVMVVVAIVIAGEKLLPRPEVIARFAGITAILAGIIMTIHWATLNYA
jgi:predicted metal-binding membrane protein